jgi:hypothetical protein
MLILGVIIGSAILMAGLMIYRDQKNFKTKRVFFPKQ